MSMRIFSLFGTGLALASCGPESAPPEGITVECAIGSGSQFSAVCTVENASLGEFLIHHPDGGFRRVQYDAATDQIGVGDGADSLRVSDASTAEMLEFAVGEDRYRIPSEIVRASSQ